LSVSCCGHDALDWLAAIGPTLATLVTAGVAWSAYRSSARIQRRLVRPRIGFRHSVMPFVQGPLGLPPAFMWTIEFHNHGQSAARITQLDVIVDGTVIAPTPLEQPGAYWIRVASLMGVSGLPDVPFLGWILTPPESLGAGVGQPLVNAAVMGPTQTIQGLGTRIEVRVTYESAFGERWVESSKTGESNE